MTADRFEIACQIADVLGTDGVYRAEVPTVPRQAVVDLMWSALSAGRILEVQVAVHTSEPFSRGGDHPMLVVEIRARRTAACA